MASTTLYPVGTPGTPWGDPEKEAWLARQTRQRNYQDDVLSVIGSFWSRFEVEQYAQLESGGHVYPLFALKSSEWNDALPTMLITGGVHGCDTSGVHGALRFADQRASAYATRVNMLIVPCVSPWAYEVVQRWDPLAIDPNRSFHADSPAPEAAALWGFIAPWRDEIAMHIDLHETTDAEGSEFRPALAARDGVVLEPRGVPDGFYLCGDSEHPHPAFQRAIIEAVAKVSHIATADAAGNLNGSPVADRGVVQYPLGAWHLCGGITDAAYRTTTVVYRGPQVAVEDCNAIQTTAICTAIEYVLACCPSENAPSASSNPAAPGSVP